VVLALARRFRQQPLQHHRVAAAFWDLEENGLLGANAYVTEGGERPALYVNFDVFGWGDTVWMMTPEPEHPLVAPSARATASRSLRLSSGDRYPPTDHLAFLRAGWPAVSYSLAGHDEIEQILQVFSGETPATMPKVMQVIHSEHDTTEQVDAAAVEAAIDAIEAALREWDAAHAG
jgi:aminopeptidase S